MKQRIRMPYDDNDYRLTPEERDRITVELLARVRQSSSLQDKKLFERFLSISKRRKRIKEYLFGKSHDDILAEYVFGRTVKSAFIILCSFSIFNVLSKYIGYDASFLGNVILACIAFFLVANSGLLFYRVRKGLFCNNEYEAREFVNFILSNLDDEDYHNSSGGKKAFLKAEQEQESREYVDNKGWASR